MSVDSYSLLAVGTGFATSFFLKRYLEKSGPDVRVLVLERGPVMSHAEQIARTPAAPFNLPEALYAPDSPLEGSHLIRAAGPTSKSWRFTTGFGGGSNCWWACTPRMMPADFAMRSRYGVGDDWPLSYEDLDPYYCDAEEIMTISGPTVAPYPMSRPYPHPPHAFSRPDEILHEAFGYQYVPQPTARSREGTANRPPCCANGVCTLCPVNAKFTIQNELFGVYEDPRVTLITEAEVLTVDTEGSIARGVTYTKEGAEVRAKGDIVVLGANAIFNAAILLASGFDDPVLGRRLHEQCGVEARVLLGGVKNFSGSTVITGNGFMFYDGPHRAKRAGCLVEGWNRAEPRLDYGRWSEVLRVRLIYEDLPLEENRVLLATDGTPEARTERRSDYLAVGLATARETFDKLLAPLPVEDIAISEPSRTEVHILGTARMGDDPATSVVDRDLVHHRVPNLLVLGSSSFVTGPPANPTLTLSALSLRAADRLVAA